MPASGGHDGFSELFQDLPAPLAQCRDRGENVLHWHHFLACFLRKLYFDEPLHFDHESYSLHDFNSAV